MDTDSAYMAISAETLDDVIKKDMRDEYEKTKSDWLPHRGCNCECKRTPGLFKLECEGSKIIALCAKCYYVDDKKNSCKGINKNQNDITWERFCNALFTEEIDEVHNMGFRVKEHSIHTYKQQKLGLSGFYDKRFVEEDGIHTRPLGIQTERGQFSLHLEEK